MPSGRGNWYAVDLSYKGDQVDLANGEVIVVGGIVPFAGVVKEVWVGQTILPTTGTIAVTKQATTPVTLLSGATVDLTSTTIFSAVHTAVQQTLSTSGAAVAVAAGNILTATWTLTSITVAGADDLYTCTVLVESDAW
jgi:hypothetical protein